MSIGTRAGGLPLKWITPPILPALAGGGAGADAAAELEVLLSRLDEVLIAASGLQPVTARREASRRRVVERVLITMGIGCCPWKGSLQAVAGWGKLDFFEGSDAGLSISDYGP
jgi:hypothetical protein